jgi:pumilio family protein 6
LHREASSVLADAFELYANAYERTILLRHFYGKETALFSASGGGETSEEEMERAKKGLKGVLEDLEGERRARVMNAVEENLAMMYMSSFRVFRASRVCVLTTLWLYVIDSIIQTKAPSHK